MNLRFPRVGAWPIYLLLVVVCVVTWYTISRRPPGTPDAILPPTVQLTQNIDIQFADVVMQGREKGHKRWTIESKTVKLSQDSRFTYFESRPKGRFFNLKDWKSEQPDNSESRRTVDWESDKATYDTVTEGLTMEGNVVIVTDDRDRITTARLEYQSREKRLMMPQKTLIVTNDKTRIRADAIEANTEAEVFELKGHVHVSTDLEEGDRL